MLKPITNQEAFEIIVKGDLEFLFFRKNQRNSDGKIPYSFERVDSYNLELTNIGKYKFYIFEE